MPYDNGRSERRPGDPASIMNYCNATWLGNGRLSALDVEAVQDIYGRS